MSSSAKKIMVRVITNKMASGKSFEEIIASYPKLTEGEVEELREAVEL